MKKEEILSEMLNYFSTMEIGTKVGKDWHLVNPKTIPNFEQCPIEFHCGLDESNHVYIGEVNIKVQGRTGEMKFGNFHASQTFGKNKETFDVFASMSERGALLSDARLSEKEREKIVFKTSIEQIKQTLEALMTHGVKMGG